MLTRETKTLKILNLIPVSVVIVLLELACSSSLAEPLAWPSVLFNLNEKIPKQTYFNFICCLHYFYNQAFVVAVFS